LQCFVSVANQGGGEVNSKPVDKNAAVGNQHPTSSFSFSASEQSTKSYINPPAGGFSSAFNMDSLRAGLQTVQVISCEQADLRDRVNQLKGRVVVCEEELNQIKLTFASDDDLAEIDFLTLCSNAVLNSLRERVETCGQSNSYFCTKIS
jgi:hypothetical protein